MKKKKILWFANSPCGSIRRNNTQTIVGGWMISLEDEVKKNPDIELSVAFFSETESEPYDFDGVRYYPMYLPKANTKIGRVLSRYKSIESEDRKMLPVMLDVVKDAHPDLIHIHGTEQRFGLIQDYVKDIPIVFSIQGLIAPYSEKFYSGLPMSEVNKHEPFLHKVRGIGISRVYKSFMYRGQRECSYLKNASFVLGRTAWDNSVTRLFNVQRKYFVVNEILRQPFYVKKWDKNQFDSTLQIVSIISPGVYKGLETLLKAAKLLVTYSNIQFVWNVIGLSNEDEYVSLCQEYTKIKACDVNVCYKGLQEAEKLSDMLVMSDLYCHVSHIENSPNSVCEAMLLGMPVIATFAGGTNSLIVDKKEGVLVQDGDPYSIAGTIVNLVNDFEYCKNMGVEARKIALKRHNPMNVAKELLDSYHKILLDYANKNN